MPFTKRPTKHPTDCRVGATADMMRQWYRIKLSLEDIYDSKVGKCQEEDSMPLNKKKKSSLEEQDIPDII